MPEIDIFTFSRLLEKKDIQQEEIEDWARAGKLPPIYGTGVSYGTEAIHTLAGTYALGAAYTSAEAQKLVEPYISEAVRTLAVQEPEALKELKEVLEKQISLLKENADLFYWTKSLTFPKLDVLPKPSEKTVDKLLDVLSQKDRMIAMLRSDLEKNDEEFARMLDRILVGFIFIFAIMVYLFLIK